ncbi:MAG: hypothetical protein ACOX6M_12515 [Armatimonadota bacterium]|jgi:hypothetical protein
MNARATALPLIALLAAPGGCQGLGRTIGVIDEAMPGRPDYGATLASILDGVSGAVASLDWDMLEGLEPADVGLVVVADPGHLPGRAASLLEAYLARGGRMLVVGNERMLTTRYVESEGAWTTLAGALEAVRPTRPLAADGTLLEGWEHSSGPSAPQSVTREATVAPDGSPGVEVSVTGLAGWDTYRLTSVADAFTDGRTVTTFWARGWGQTHQLLVECQEMDGARWMASVPLGPQWAHYALTPSDFSYWSDSPSTGRGGEGDALNLSALSVLALGIATGHGPTSIAPGDHRWAVAGLGTAPSPVGEADTYGVVLECLMPWYKTYQLDGFDGVRATEHGRLAGLSETLSPQRGPALCAVTRPRGLGLAGATAPGRFVPLAEAVDASGEWRGNLAYVWHQTEGERAGARWGAVGVPPSEEAAPLIRATARTLLERAALTRAGASEWAVFDDEPPMALGAEIAGGHTAVAGVTVRFVVEDELGVRVMDRTVDVDPVAAMQTATVDGGAAPPLAPGFYTVRTSLALRGRPVDIITQRVSVHPSAAESDPRIELSEDGTQFELDGERFMVHGINYWPLYASGADPEWYWSHWLSSNQYDPDAVERDLALMERLGVNVVSIQYQNEDMSRPLVDFLARCRRHGVYANVYLPNTHPLGFSPAHARALLTLPRLARNPAVFAYDLAWEPNLGREGARAGHDPAWRQWIEDNYGSIEVLERAMGGPLPRDAEGAVTGPSDALLMETDPDDSERVFVAAYRHFADDLISSGYGRVAAFIRDELGDGALLGVRTGYGGTGQPWIVPAMAFDLLSGAAHLDCTQPEGYGIDGEWINYRYGGFTTQYGRWAGNGKPVWWAEYGRSVYSGEAEPTEEMVELQRRLYENTFRMVLESRADGTAGWWWPGGYRVGERSDYGVINPDGTPRPAALEMMRFALDIAALEPPPQPTVRIVFDRDLYPMGYAGVWLAHREEYADAIARGDWVELLTEATGTTTEDFPRVSIGNVPWSPGMPFKHLKGEIHGPVLLRDGAPRVFVDTLDSPLAPGPYEMELRVVNTSEVTWLPGDVVLTVTAGAERHRIALAERVPRYAETTVRLPVDIPADGVALEARLSLEGQPFGVPLRRQLGG